jgi:hypothetical protein
MTTRRILFFAVLMTVSFNTALLIWVTGKKILPVASACSYAPVFELVSRSRPGDVFYSQRGRYIAVVLSRGSIPERIFEFLVFDVQTCATHRAESSNPWSTSDIRWTESEERILLEGLHATINCLTLCRYHEYWLPDGSARLCGFNIMYPEKCS